MSRELFEAQLKVLASRVEKECRKRSPEAQTFYEIQGSDAQMRCDFHIHSDQGQDDIEIMYSNGNISYMVVQAV